MATVFISVVVLMINSAMLVDSVFRCYQSADSPCSNHAITCDKFRRIIIRNLNYYAKQSNIICPESQDEADCLNNYCCSYSGADRKEPFSQQDMLRVYEACSNQQSCVVTSPYSPDTGYHYVEYDYSCSRENNMRNIMTTGWVFPTAWLALYYSGKDSPVAGITCSCDISCEISSGGCNIHVDILYIYLSGESCNRITVKGDDIPQYTCNDNGTFVGYKSVSSPISTARIELNNMTSSYQDVFWVAFEGEKLTSSCDCRNPTLRNGGWSNWSEYSDCSVTCGGGTNTRTRKCDSPSPANGGTNCPGIFKQNGVCNEHGCPVDGGWSVWTPYNRCSVSCGEGTTTRLRECNNPPPTNGGDDCTGDSSQNAPCNPGTCPGHGGWSVWSSYNNCSVSCGEGTATRLRECSNPPPTNGGDDCTGDSSQNVMCNLTTCSVDGGWSVWSSYNNCSVSCGEGTATRLRECNNPPPTNGGDDCTGDSSQNAPCNLAACPGTNGMSMWIIIGVSTISIILVFTIVCFIRRKRLANISALDRPQPTVPCEKKEREEVDDDELYDTIDDMYDTIDDYMVHYDTVL